MILKNAKHFYDGSKKIVYGLRNGILPLSKKDDMKSDISDQQPDILDAPVQTELNDFLIKLKKSKRIKHEII